jgi:hypothetical protein
MRWATFFLPPSHDRCSPGGATSVLLNFGVRDDGPLDSLDDDGT